MRPSVKIIPPATDPNAAKVLTIGPSLPFAVSVGSVEIPTMGYGIGGYSEGGHST